MRGKKALVSLLLLLPAPAIGTTAGMLFWPGTTHGQIVFAASKLWVLLLPSFWYLVIERQRPSWSPPRKGGLGIGILLGIGTMAFIGVAYLLLGRYLIDPAVIKTMAVENRLDRLCFYLLGTTYWCFINSVLEEYVWRWFVVRQAERLLPGKLAVLVSALGFTVHHVIATHVFFPWPLVALASIGIFTGATVWSWLYQRYRSIWPGYLAHVGADIVIFTIGYFLIFE